MSSKTSYTTTTVTDNSNLQAQGNAVRGDGNTSTTVTNTLDGGAIAQSFDLAGQSLTGAGNAYQQALGLVGSFGQQSAKQVIDAVQSNSQDASNKISQAFSTATGSLNTNTVYIIGAILAVVAVLFVVKK